MSLRPIGLLLVFALLMMGGALAQTNHAGMPDEPPFVEHRVALQLSDESEAKQTQVLNNAFNILKVYGPDQVAIEVVTFGPGVELLREGNPTPHGSRALSSRVCASMFA